jgi:sialic acid synthase SpsE
MFSYPIAFSDHTPGWEMDIAAISMGANIIEKTITLDRTTRSCEHIMSLEPPEMKVFVKVIREVEIAFGKSRRVMSAEELERRDAIRRGAFLTRGVSAGERLERKDLDFRRPGHGIRPDEIQYFLGMRFARDLENDHMLTQEDLS